jgi:hypothetical protein
MGSGANRSLAICGSANIAVGDRLARVQPLPELLKQEFGLTYDRTLQGAAMSLTSEVINRRARPLRYSPVEW